MAKRQNNRLTSVRRTALFCCFSLPLPGTACGKVTWLCAGSSASLSDALPPLVRKEINAKQDGKGDKSRTATKRLISSTSTSRTPCQSPRPGFKKRKDRMTVPWSNEGPCLCSNKISIHDWNDQRLKELINWLKTSENRACLKASTYLYFEVTVLWRKKTGTGPSKLCVFAMDVVALSEMPGQAALTWTSKNSCSLHKAKAKLLCQNVACSILSEIGKTV